MYRIIGDDGNVYGPVPAEQLNKWVAEGRANAETRTAVEGSTEWKPLGSIPEFAPAFARTAAAPAAAPAVLASLAPARKTNGFAIASLVLGIISLTLGLCRCYGFPLNFFGLISALIALSQIKQNPQQYDGRGAAIAGLVLSLVSLVLAAVLILILGLHSGMRGVRPHVYRL